MMRALVALVAVLLAGCAGPKPPAPASVPPAPVPAASQPSVAMPAPTAPTTPTPDPPSTAAPAPAAPAPEPAPVVQILYVKTHLANFREGVGTSRRILRVLSQGERLQVLESRSNWLRVRLNDGQEGWIAESVTSATAPVTPTHAPAPGRGPSEITRA